MSPGALGSSDSATVRPKPVQMPVMRTPSGTCQPNRRAHSVGPSAAPNALHANNTREKIGAGRKSATNTASSTTMNTAHLPRCKTCGLPFSVPSVRSWDSVLAQTSSWLSAVDMIAESTAASSRPASTGGSTFSDRAKKTCSLLFNESKMPRPTSPVRTIPEKTTRYQMRVMRAAVRRAR